jgi:hypothetical protein
MYSKIDTYLASASKGSIGEDESGKRRRDVVLSIHIHYGYGMVPRSKGSIIAPMALHIVRTPSRTRQVLLICPLQHVADEHLCLVGISSKSGCWLVLTPS